MSVDLQLERDRLTAGGHALSEEGAVLSVSHRRGIDADGVTRVERALRPVVACENARTGEFDGPCLWLAAGRIVHVNPQNHMRIHPVEALDLAFQRHRLLQI